MIFTEGDTGMHFQDTLYTIFEEPEKSKMGFILNSIIYVLIIVSILNLMLSSVESLQSHMALL